jgi:hypothetical protein
VRREFLRAVPGNVFGTATAEAMPPLDARPLFILRTRPRSEGEGGGEWGVAMSAEEVHVTEALGGCLGVTH